jgi:hypothetical protein
MPRSPVRALGPDPNGQEACSSARRAARSQPTLGRRRRSDQRRDAAIQRWRSLAAAAITSAKAVGVVLTDFTRPLHDAIQRNKRGANKLTGQGRDLRRDCGCGRSSRSVSARQVSERIRTARATLHGGQRRDNLDRMGRASGRQVSLLRRITGNAPHRFDDKHTDRGYSVDRRATAVVIGGGIAGVTAALTLAERGMAVTLLERGHRLGGPPVSVA